MLSELTAGPGAVFSVTINGFHRALKSHFGSGAGGSLYFWEFLHLIYKYIYIYIYIKVLICFGGLELARQQKTIGVWTKCKCSILELNFFSHK